jgi:hypothetical protein
MAGGSRSSAVTRRRGDLDRQTLASAFSPGFASARRRCAAISAETAPGSGAPPALESGDGAGAGGSIAADEPSHDAVIGPPGLTATFIAFSDSAARRSSPALFRRA